MGAHVAPPNGSGGRHRELHAKAVQHFQDRVVARLGVPGERLVEALAAEAGAVGNRADAACLGDVADRGEETSGLSSSRAAVRYSATTSSSSRKALGSNSLTRTIRSHVEFRQRELSMVDIAAPGFMSILDVALRDCSLKPNKPNQQRRSHESRLSAVIRSRAAPGRRRSSSGRRELRGLSPARRRGRIPGRTRDRRSRGLG